MRAKVNWDAIGISASLICAIHCAILPLFMVSLPLMGVELIHNHYFEYGMIFLAFLIGSYSLYHGYKQHHHKKYPLFLFSIGIMLLVLKEVFHNYSLVFLFPAVILIVVSHIANYKQCRGHNHAHADDCNHDHY